MEHDCVKTLQVSRNLGQTPVWPFFFAVGGRHAAEQKTSRNRVGFSRLLFFVAIRMAASYIRKFGRMAASYTPV